MRLFLKYYLILLALCLPQIASAHSPIKGIGDFFNGILHPIFAPEQLLLLLALGLFYGQHQPNQNKATLLYFMLAVVAGLLAGDYLLDIDKSLPLLALTLIISLFIVIARHLYQPLFIALVIIAGLLLGLDSAQEALTGKAKLVTLFGSSVGIYFLILYSMAVSETFSHRPWQIIAARILASWLSASALMVLALRFAS